MSVATLGRVNLSGIAKKAEKTKTEYPAIEDARAQELAGLILKLTDESEAIEANLAINKADLRSLVVPEFFRRFAGRVEVPSSMAVRSADGREVLVSMTSRYKQPTNLDQLVALLGEDHAERFLKPSFKLEIDSSKISQEQQQEVINAIAGVLGAFGCADALSAKEATAPTDDFHTARHTIFDVEKNMAIENIMPMTVAVKTKGRK
jgi:hypothetical protein